MTEVEENIMSVIGPPNFSIIDYIVFILTIVVSLVIGAYYGIKENKTTEDFLMAGRNMSPVPVALSLIATFISSIAMLGYVGEVYGHGITLAWNLVGGLPGFFLATYVFLPIIYPLKLNSINEYLELRFRSVAVKRCAMLQSTITCLIYLGLCLYAPTLALESVTPLSSNFYIVLLGSVVTIYSSFGGLKAVVWTDAFQTGVIILGLLLTAGTALYTAGGVWKVWEIASQHERANLKVFSVGLFTRHTAINVCTQTFFSYLFVFSFSQIILQRTAVLKSYKEVQIVMGLACLGNFVNLLLLFVAGLSIFAVYANCDPIGLNLIHRKDQMMPFYVMDQLGWIKGVPGIFVACLFSGTMSSISTVLNSLPSMLWADLFSHFSCMKNASERCKTITNKLITVLLGCLMMGLAVLASKMGGLIQATSTLMSIIGGPSSGLFLTGTCLPMCGKRSVLVGLGVSLAFSTWLAIGMQVYNADVPMLPLNTDQCSNATIIHAMVSQTTLSQTTLSQTTLSQTTLSQTTVGQTSLFNSTDLYNMSSTTPMIDLYNMSTTRMTDVYNMSSTTPMTDVEPNYEDAPFYDFYQISYTLLGPLGTIICMLVAIIDAGLAGRENMEEVDPKYIIPCLRKYCGKKEIKDEKQEIPPSLISSDSEHALDVEKKEEISLLSVENKEVKRRISNGSAEPALDVLDTMNVYRA